MSVLVDVLAKNILSPREEVIATVSAQLEHRHGSRDAVRAFFMGETAAFCSLSLCRIAQTGMFLSCSQGRFRVLGHGDNRTVAVREE